jgi:hypothetical protein
VAGHHLLGERERLPVTDQDDASHLPTSQARLSTNPSS